MDKRAQGVVDRRLPTVVEIAIVRHQELEITIGPVDGEADGRGEPAQQRRHGPRRDIHELECLPAVGEVNDTIGDGGAIGLAFGIGASVSITKLINSLSSGAGWPVVVSIPAGIVAMFFAAVVGLVFGLYSAWRASRLDPIDALRYE